MPPPSSNSQKTGCGCCLKKLLSLLLLFSPLSSFSFLSLPWSSSSSSFQSSSLSFHPPLRRLTPPHLLPFSLSFSSLFTLIVYTRAHSHIVDLLTHTHTCLHHHVSLFTLLFTHTRHSVYFCLCLHLVCHVVLFTFV